MRARRRAAIAGRRWSLAERRPGTSSTNTSPSRIKPINVAVRAVGLGPPSAQVSNASRMGNTLATSSASATGTRATAEYRHRLCAVIRRPNSNCQRQAPAGRRRLCLCHSTSAGQHQQGPARTHQNRQQHPGAIIESDPRRHMVAGERAAHAQQNDTARWRGKGGGTVCA